MSSPEDGGDLWIQFHLKKILMYVPENDSPRSIQINASGQKKHKWRPNAVPQLTTR